MIGPTFPAELKEAGLAGLPFSWGDNGTFAFSESMTTQEKEAVLAIYAAHDPLKPVVPFSVTKRQATQALILADKLDAVEAVLNSMQGKAGRLARAEWQESQIVERNRPLTHQLGQSIGLTPERIDQIFIDAAQL